MSPKYWHRLTDCDPRPAPPPPSSLPSFTVGDSSWVVPPHFPVQPPRVQCTPRNLGSGSYLRGAAQLSCPGSEGVRRGGQPGGSELARSGSSSSHRRRRKGGEVGRSRGGRRREEEAQAPCPGSQPCGKARLLALESGGSAALCSGPLGSLIHRNLRYD